MRPHVLPTPSMEKAVSEKIDRYKNEKKSGLRFLRRFFVFQAENVTRLIPVCQCTAYEHTVVRVKKNTPEEKKQTGNQISWVSSQALLLKCPSLRNPKSPS